MPETIELKLGNGTLSIQIPKNQLFRLDAIFKEQEYAIADPGPVHSVADIGLIATLARDASHAKGFGVLQFRRKG